MTKSEINVTIQIKYNTIFIFINDVLHVYIKRSELLGVQSWIFEHENKYYIEYIMKGNSIQSDYDSKEKWLAVLNELKKVLPL